jgi:class 3 adenylate cyclase
MALGEYPKTAVAERAGVDPEFVDRLLDLGILTPTGDGEVSPGAVRRTRLLHGLERAGFPLDGLATAIAGGAISFAFLDHPVFNRFSGLTETTFRRLSEETGIPVETLLVVREAIGFGPPIADDRVREDELLIVPAIQHQVERGIKTTVIERWLRVYGDSARRMAETEADWWRTEVEGPLIESGVGEGVVLDLASQWGATVAPLLDQALLALYHGHEEHAWLANIIHNVENALDEAGLRSKLARPPAICFLDITGYTRLTEERGDEAAADLAARLADMVQRTSQLHRGKPVKWLGDGVMFYFGEPGSAVLAAMEMVEDVAAKGLPAAHVGVHAGPVVFQQGDYFGRTVNIAARVSDYARPGEVLVTQDVVDASSEDRVSFSEIGPVELKGIPDALHLYAALRQP